MPPVTGLLVSQIGYDIGLPKRALVRGPAHTLSANGAMFTIERMDDLETVLTGSVTYWGELWGSAWWVADFSALDEEDEYLLTISDESTGQGFVGFFDVGEKLLWRQTWKAVGLEQSERRAKLANGGNGWYDAGTAWQEADSHAALLVGLLDVLEIADAALSADDRARLEAQILNGCDYLARLQDLAAHVPNGDGAVVHQSFKFETLVLPSDVSKAALVWTRAARLLSEPHAAKRTEYLARAQRALNWLQTAVPLGSVGFSHLNHGAPAGSAVPLEWMTRDVTMHLWVALELTLSGADNRLAECAALADVLLARQVGEAQPEGAYYGHFRTFDSVDYTEKAWVHNGEGNCWGADIGGHFPHYILPLLALCERWPAHPDAARWRQAVHDFAYGYFLPTCRANPFYLLPLGYFAGQGLLYFAGSWHGMNAAYGLAAVLGMAFARFFADAAFVDIAVGNLQWIAGLNAGLTRDSLFASLLFTMDIPEGEALPVSMIHGIGTRQAGSWLNLQGAICNGFSVGDQFHFDTPATLENDAPSAFTDEDWISHAGGWLSGLARLTYANDR